ncbi:MAG: hypothetical protein GY707_12260, partial [Desulfobacteraceae bacterium]|nr:hypothetical protein [Desulfobacteraceae bacterium]
MSPEKIAFYVQIGVAIIAIPIIITFALNIKKMFHHKGRDGKLMIIANKHGLTFKQKPGKEFFEKIVNFDILERSMSKKAHNLMSGTIKGHDIKIFDLVYTIMMGTNIGSYKKNPSLPQNLTASLVGIKDTKVDLCIVSKKGVWCKDNKTKNIIERSQLVGKLNQTPFDIKVA